MSDTSPPFDFSQYLPGFDFLKSLAAIGAQQAAGPASASLSNWIAPTLNVDEIDKRLREFKAVQFWLEQNLGALKATVQALEVQKMTLSTLQGMNLRMEDIANTFAAAAPPPQAPSPASGAKAEKDPPAPAGAIDPLQWWNALTQQFQSIANQTLREAARGAPSESAPPQQKKKRAARKAQPAAAPAARKRTSRSPPPGP